MRDYSQLSDFEINALVSKELYGPVSRDHQMELANGTVDYCNSPGDAWPIITENLIGIAPVYQDGTTKWLASTGEEHEIYSVEATGLRAAMIVFLKMKEKMVA